MKLSTRLFLLGMSIAGLAASATTHADDSRRDQQIDSKFKAADKNNDGKLTREEAKAGMPRVARGFSKIDAQNKGYVTADEIKAMANN
jgi:Ca2+-binding EF-hand superfamily protein